MFRAICGAVVAILVLAAGAGCGGGSDETVAELTKAQFVKKADQICVDSKKQRFAAAEEEYNPKQRQGSHVVGAQATKDLEAELAELGEEVLTEKIIPLMREQQEELEALDAPAADEPKVQKMLGNMDKAIGEVEDAGYNDLAGANQFDVFEKEAEDYGLNCEVI